MDNNSNNIPPQPLPPYYVLVSHTSVSNAAPGAPSSNFSHPAIQYHYQDDSALPLLPQHPDEHVLVVDYHDPSSQETLAVKSISHSLVVTGLNVDEAPGASAADGKNNRMFVIETTSDDHPQSSPLSERKSPHTILAQFKHRNAVLRRALVYPEGSQVMKETEEARSNPHPDQVSSPPPSL